MKAIGADFVLKKIIKRFPRVSSIIIGCIVSLFIIVFIESVCYVLNSFNDSGQESIIKKMSNGYYKDDYILGYKPSPNIEATASMSFQGEMVYKVRYSIDHHSRRITPVEGRKRRDRYALFFGGSYTFGEGVEDDETLPAYFSRQMTSYMPYNYGFHGYGPHQMLAKLIAVNINDEIEEENGVLIYIYLSRHINRAIGDMYVFNKWGKWSPYYTIDNEGDLVRKGNFISGRSFISKLYNLLSRSYFIKYFNINFPLWISKRHYRLITKIIEESRKEFLNQFTNGDFIVLLYPTEEKWKESTRKIIPYLVKANIKYLDYTGLFDPTDEDFRNGADQHPSPTAYETIAKKLAEDLSSLKQ